MPNKLTGLIFNIKKFAIHDGPGIRTTIFLKGCPLNCWWCHNPESQHPKIKKIGDSVIGRKISVQELMDEILQDQIFYDESDGGVTFSGGEPLMQPAFLEYMLKSCGEEEIHRCVDTSGFCEHSIFSQIAKQTDLFLYDVKFIDASKHLKYTGKSNEKILQNLRYLDEKKNQTRIRFPLIPGINDTPKDLKLLKNFLLSLKSIRNIDILPYHKMGTQKYQSFFGTFKLPDVQEPNEEYVQNIKNKLEQCGMTVKIGG